MTYSKLFVVGCPRSGTTWLRSMLIPHSRIIEVPSESQAYSVTYHYFTYFKKQKLEKRLKSALWILKYYGLKPLFLGFESDDIWKGILKNYRIYQSNKYPIGLDNLVNYSELKELMSKARSTSGNDITNVKILIQLMFDQFFEKNRESGQDILLEKTPQHVRYIDVILNQFPEAKVVEIIRDGRDVCVSYQARGKTQYWANQSTESVIKIWKQAIRNGEKAKANPEISDRIYSVRYENLRTSPQEELTKIFDFVGLDYDQAFVDKIIDRTDISKIKNKGEDQHVRKGSIGEWKTRLSSEDIALWEELAGDMLSRLGYEV
ncbi:sulfotransferase [Roseofilum sp. BLCC_M91]|uniref:Sulfotransferase n=1 Tax=Roseofilum halophilum BLCC-M91 TaxID=3022259 RepID=A0ABT7BRH2_9CYAN|nr:sulfotransferase [Roseofilum halophilum]MDJ1181357.1 sulfotransferase [Roseofilum halophilum BLCC-M91]